MPISLAACRNRSLLLLSIGLLSACQGKDAVTDSHEGHSHAPQALFTNGGFENGNLNGWTVTTNLNNSGVTYPPATISDLHLSAGGVNYTSVVTGATDSQIPAGLTSGATLRVPRYGSNVAVVNRQGSNYNVNTLSQSMTTSNADVDPADGKVHVRFAIAPVLQNPGHANTEQPYFWVQLRNVTKGVVLFQTFNFANQPGVPWKADPVNTSVLYTDWQAFDISPGAAQLAVGDQVEIQVIAAGCAQGGHWGEVYVDAFGPSIPGLQVSATAPQAVNTGSQLTYTFNYSNGGTAAAANTTIQETIPAGTTFASVNAPGASCTTPAVGGTGNVVCNIGTLNPSSSGSFSVTVNVTAIAGATISNGTYQISADSVSPLIGPLVTTSVTSGVTYANLGVTVTDGVAAVNWGSTTTYTVVVTNSGPSAANGTTVSAPLPTNISSWSWTCSGSNGGTCGAGSGSGAISTTANLPSGGSVTYSVTADVASGSGSSTIANTVTATAPGGITDSDNTNNTAVDYNQVGTLRTLTLNKSGGGQGSVVSSPAAISCGAACNSQSAVFIDGTSVVLTASTQAGNRFIQWSAGPCAGSTSPSCTVTLSADTTAAAEFASGDWLVAGSASSGNGTVSCTSPVLNAAGSTCTITPSATYRLTALTDNGSNVLGSVSGGSYTIASVTADHTIIGTFAANSASVALSASPTSSSFGQSVTFTATVTAGAPAGTPTGTVTFSDGATPICSGVTVTGGLATCTTSALSVASHSVTAAYSGDSTYPAANSSTLSFVVSQATSSLALTSDQNPSVLGQPVTLTATVSSSGGTPTGTVAFTESGTPLSGCGAVALSAGVATCSSSSLSLATHTILATYSGSGSFQSSNNTVSQVVNRANSTVSLGSSGSPTVYGQTVTFTATVAAAAFGNGTPTGTVNFLDGAALIGSGTLSGGVASLQISTLAAGAHSITAQYLGSSSYNGNTSSSTSHQVNIASTNVALTGGPSPSAFGETVTYNVTVTASAPSAAIPDGTVQFYDGATLLGSASLNGSGQASFSTSSLGVGGHSITAVMVPNARFAGNTSSAQSQTVVPASTTTSLVSSLNPSTYGLSVTFSATVAAVAPGTGTPTGTVTFRDGATVLGTANLNGSGVATLSTAGLTAGSHTVTAEYAGDGNYTGSSTASPTTQVVSQASASVAVSISPEPTVFGQSATVNVTVSSSAGTPSGQASVEIDGVVVTTLTLNGSGAASYSSASLAVGSHNVVIHYLGASDYLTADSSTSTHQVNKAATEIALGVSPSPSQTGQAATLTATVTVTSPGAGQPTGTVTFYDNGNPIGTGAVNPSTGQATLTTSSLSTGSHSFTVSYGGDGSFETSSTPGGNAVSHTVSQGNVAVTVTPSAPSVAFGQAVTVTVNVAAVSPATGTPTGSVTLRDGAATLGVLTLSGGSASYTSSSLAVGTHPLSADYGGDGSFNTASGSGSLNVGISSSTLALSTSPSPSMYGQSITLTAQLSAPGAGTPSGTVTFMDGSTTLGTASVNPSGIATLSVSSLEGGSHNLSASYGGDTSFQSSSGTSSHVVNAGSTTVSVSTSKTPARAGRPVVFTVTVTSPHSTPDGTVTIHDTHNGVDTVLGTITLSNGSGTLIVRTLTKGAHEITAQYDGNGNFAAASGSLSGGQTIENSPPVAGAGSALALGTTAAASASVDASGGSLDRPTTTVELWAKAGWTDATAVQGNAGLIKLGTSNAARYALGVAPDRKGVVITLDTTETVIPATLDDGAWHHLALVAETDAVTLLVDGTVAGHIQSPIATSITGGTLTLGSGFIGELDELRIWNGVRTEAQLSADSRRPLHGNETDLIAYWRMDEGSGSELFDSGPNYLDGAVSLAQDGNEAFTASNAWRLRHVWEGRAMTPVDAGYDVDGDPLTLTVSAAPVQGSTTVDAANLQVNYRASNSYLGSDQFTFQLDDGSAQSSYTIDVQVDRILVCQVNADCGGGDLCVQGQCQAPSNIDGRAGSGCSSSSGGSLSLWAMLLLALAVRFRSKWPVSRSLRALVAIGLVSFGARSMAQTMEGFALQTYEPPPAGDQFFSVSDASTPGHLAPAAALTLSWAADPLVLRQNGQDIPGGRIVHRQFWAFAQGSLGLGERFLVDLTVPVALYQSGSQPLPDLAKVSATNIADLKLGARYAIGTYRGLSVAGAVDLWLPAGSRTGFASDGAVRFRPKAIVSGEWNKLAYSGELGVLLRGGNNLTLTETGTAVSFAAAAAWREGEFRFGPEIFGRYQFAGTATSPIEGLLAGHWSRGAFDTGLAFGTGFNRAPGAAPFRVLAQVSWKPGRVKPAPAPAPEPAPPPAPEPPPPPPPATEIAPVPEPAPEPAPAPAPAPEPAPAPAPELVKLTKDKIEILQSIQFESSKDVIRSESEPVLHEVAQVLTNHPEISKVRIEGHTDSKGSKTFNTRLSDQRAQAVKKWLTSKGGIAPERLEAKGYGPAQPIAPNTTEEGRAKNRRVIFRILEQK